MGDFPLNASHTEHTRQGGLSHERKTFGKFTALVTDGHIPCPYGRETTGYEVAHLAETLAKAQAAGVAILVAPYTADRRTAAMVQFHGGYIAEIHSAEASPK
jgi:hypothetical protein